VIDAMEAKEWRKCAGSSNDTKEESMTLGPSPSLCCSFPSSLLLISSALSPKLLITSGFLTSEIGQRARTVHQAPSLPCDLGQVTFLLYISRGWVTFQALLATKQKLKAKIQDPSPLLQAFFIFTPRKDPGSSQDLAYCFFSVLLCQASWSVLASLAVSAQF
jgi:hypothetical protein